MKKSILFILGLILVSGFQISSVEAKTWCCPPKDKCAPKPDKCSPQAKCEPKDKCGACPEGTVETNKWWRVI